MFFCVFCLNKLSCAGLKTVFCDRLLTLMTVVFPCFTKLIWTGWIFRVPLSTLYKMRKDGGLGMVHVLAICEALYLNRTHQQLTKQDNLTAQWIMQHMQHPAVCTCVGIHRILISFRPSGKVHCVEHVLTGTDCRS